MSIQNNITEQLVSLKALTRATGCLHEAQLLQLRMWPYFLYPKVKIKYELRIDQDSKTVEYALKFPGKAPSDLKQKGQELEEVFQWLLGVEWLLKLSVGPKVVFKGTRRVSEIKVAEKKAYSPFTKAINEYMDRDWSKK